MARKKSANKFLTLEEFEKFQADMIERKGAKRYTTFLAKEITGTAYQTMRAKFAEKKLEKVTRDNAERFFELLKVRKERDEAREQLAKAKEFLK